MRAVSGDDRSQQAQPYFTPTEQTFENTHPVLMPAIFEAPLTFLCLKYASSSLVSLGILQFWFRQ